MGPARLCERRPTILRHVCNRHFQSRNNSASRRPANLLHDFFANLTQYCGPAAGSRPCPTLHPTGRNFKILHGVAVRGLKCRVRKRRIPTGLTPRLGCVPVCSVRFRLFLAIDINPVPATGIDDPSQKRESCRLSHRESETRAGDRPGARRPPVRRGLPSARPVRRSDPGSGSAIAGRLASIGRGTISHRWISGVRHTLCRDPTSVPKGRHGCSRSGSDESVPGRTSRSHAGHRGRHPLRPHGGAPLRLCGEKVTRELYPISRCRSPNFPFAKVVACADVRRAPPCLSGGRGIKRRLAAPWPLTGGRLQWT